MDETLICPMSGNIIELNQCEGCPIIEDCECRIEKLNKEEL